MKSFNKEYLGDMLMGANELALWLAIAITFGIFFLILFLNS
jgi:hypothetical protein